MSFKKLNRYELRMSFDEAWCVLELLDMFTFQQPNDIAAVRVQRRLERLLVDKKHRDASRESKHGS